MTAPVNNLPEESDSVENHIETPVRLRLLLVCSHVVQYASPVFAKMAQDPKFDILVSYCSMQGAKAGIDPGFGVEISWDGTLLDGYSWVHPSNKALRPGLGRFFGLLNPGLWKIIRDGNFDAIYLSGYFYASAWIAILAAKWHGIPVILTTEASSLRSLRNYGTRSGWTLRLKKLVVKRIFSFADVLLAVSSGAVQHLLALGFAKNTVILAPYAVDNEWWTQQAALVDRNAIRAKWQIPNSARVVLFCAKLQTWKAPKDLLDAFAKANLPDSYLVFAGDGPLLPEIKHRADALSIAHRVRYLGFVNQSYLPSIYCSSDLLVLPSLYDGFGLVVNEAMLCGCPVAISDRVGAKFDLVRSGETGYVFSAGDQSAIIAVLRDFFSDEANGPRLSEAARIRMMTWSPDEYVTAMARAVELAKRCRYERLSRIL